MKTSDFYYDLPQELICPGPSGGSKQLQASVLDRKTGEMEHRVFRDITEYLRPGDCLVVNNTKVIPARLLGGQGRYGSGNRDSAAEA